MALSWSDKQVCWFIFMSYLGRTVSSRNIRFIAGLQPRQQIFKHWPRLHISFSLSWCHHVIWGRSVYQLGEQRYSMYDLEQSLCVAFIAVIKIKQESQFVTQRKCHSIKVNRGKVIAFEVLFVTLVMCTGGTRWPWTCLWVFQRGQSGLPILQRKLEVVFCNAPKISQYVT